jgi:hypothetical protein
MRLMWGDTEIGMDELIIYLPDQCELAFEWEFEGNSYCYSC